MYNDRKRGSAALPIQRRSTSPVSRAHREEDTPILKKVILCSLSGVGVSLAAGILLVTAASFFASVGSDPLSLIPTLALASLLPANFLGGLVSSKRCACAALACGAMTSGMWCAASLILAMCCYSAPPSGYELWQGLLLHGSSVLFCMLGALAGGIKRKPSHKKRRFG